METFTALELNEKSTFDEQNSVDVLKAVMKDVEGYDAESFREVFAGLEKNEEGAIS